MMREREISYCEACGVVAETRHVAFYQNIGALIVRFSSSAEGHLCKSCIHRYFWSMTTINLLLGWWGVISFILNPFLILNNIIRYVGCLGMKAPAALDRGEGAAPAQHPAHRPDTESECYLCGKPLQPEERPSRVCRSCS